MDLQTTLLGALNDYGAIAIFVAVLCASIGLPLPTSFLLIVAGSFVQNGELEFVPVMLAGTAGAVLGDHLGYGIGRYGGRGLINRIVTRLNAHSLMQRAETTMHQRGGISVFLSRWLITAIGPYINLVSGVTRYKPAKFSLWVVLGEALWVLAYVLIGRLFSDSVSEISDMLGDFTGVLLAIAAVGVIGYLLFRNLRQARPTQA
jgi:membrane protein DedA with SNARE-associated domain